jgi:hypothetical protein
MYVRLVLRTEKLKGEAGLLRHAVDLKVLLLRAVPLVVDLHQHQLDVEVDLEFLEAPVAAAGLTNARHLLLTQNCAQLPVRTLGTHSALLKAGREGGGLVLPPLPLMLLKRVCMSSSVAPAVGPSAAKAETTIRQARRNRDTRVDAFMFCW